MGDEKSNPISQLKTRMDKFNQQYREEMKRVEMSAPDRLQDLFNDLEKKFKALKESENLIIQELEKQEAVYQACQIKLDRDIEKYNQNQVKLQSLFFVAVTQRKFDGRRIKKLVEEEKVLRKRIFDRQVQIGATGLEKMRCGFKFTKLVTDENDMEGMKEVAEMERGMKEMEDEFEKFKLNEP